MKKFSPQLAIGDYVTFIRNVALVQGHIVDYRNGIFLVWRHDGNGYLLMERKEFWHVLLWTDPDDFSGETVDFDAALNRKKHLIIEDIIDLVRVIGKDSK